MAWQKLKDPTPDQQPFDGGHYLVADDVAVSEARYHPDNRGWWVANTDPTDYHDGQIFPTHWQPMPAPPKL